MRLCLFLFAIIGTVSIVHSQTKTKLPDKTLWTPLQCRNGILGPNDDRMAIILKCPIDCRFFCHASALGLLEESGLPSEQTYDDWVDATFPEKHREFSKAWFANCFRRYGTKIDLNDKECLMADSLADCSWAVQSHLDCPKDNATKAASGEADYNYYNYDESR